MNELKRRLRFLDEADPPDLWEEVGRRESGRHSREPWRGRVLAVAVAFAVVTASSIVLFRSLREEISPAQLPLGPESSAVIADPPLRCTVRMDAPSVSPGESAWLTFSVENLGIRPIRVTLEGRFGLPSIRITTEDGREVVARNSDAVGGSEVGGGSWPDIGPGESWALRSGFVTRWGGRLSLEPACGYQLVTTNAGGRPEFGTGGWIDVPPLEIDVVADGIAPSPEDAVGRALAHTGGLFDQCRPGADGVPVDGVLVAPGPAPDQEPINFFNDQTDVQATIPGIDGDRLELRRQIARCAAVVDPYDSFVAVDLVFAAPRDVPLPPSGQALPGRTFDLPAGPDEAQAGIWSFLVLADEVIALTSDELITRAPGGGGPIVVYRGPPHCNELTGVSTQNPGPPECLIIGFQLMDGRWVGGRGGGDGSLSGVVLFVADWPRE